MTVDRLVKEYRPGSPPAVAGLSFSVRPGEVFGLLGPNGAGKTTTVGVLTTRVLPTSGRALVHGVDVVRDPTRAKRVFAVVPQRTNLDRSLTVRQNLLFHAAYHGVGRAERTRLADEVLARMGLADQADSRVDWMSGGQSQRVMIARALMHEPAVVFLDEPTSGLDPQARLFLHDRIAELRARGVTVVLTTHDMEEAAKLCDRVGIVDHGRLLAEDTPAALVRGLPGSTTLGVAVAGAADRDGLSRGLSDAPGVDRVELVDTAPAFPTGPGGGFPGMPPGGPFPMPGGIPSPPAGRTPGGDRAVLRLYLSQDVAAVLPVVLDVIRTAGAEVRDVSIGEPSLEDVFIRLTGRELR
ncbi:Vitamin B12 import ATP-binding protein BtuD [Actinosynnema sp. ALI-1.44]